MNCPNCNNDRLYTIETFQTKEQAVRTKKCKACQWAFTSREEIADEVEIPKYLRDLKRRAKDPA